MSDAVHDNHCRYSGAMVDLDDEYCDCGKALKMCQDEIERLRKGIRAVNGLIHESRGVTGLHLNGDVAMWDDLLRGGKYEEWLLDFSAACEAGGDDGD